MQQVILDETGNPKVTLVFALPAHIFALFEFLKQQSISWEKSEAYEQTQEREW